MKATFAALALLMIAVVGIPTVASAACIEFNDAGVSIDRGGPCYAPQAVYPDDDGD